MHKLLAIAVVFLTFTIACDRNGVFEQNLLIPNEEWALDSIASFTPSINDTISAHNIYVNIRNSVDYPNSNLFLFITTTAPTGAILRDTLEIYLADPKGNWLGKGFGRIRDNQMPYKTNIRFPSAGVYKFDIQHGMRTEVLKNLVSVGLRIELHD